MLHMLGSHHVNRGKIHKSIRGLCWSNKVKIYETVFMALRSVLYFYVVPLCGDLLSYWVSVLCPVVFVFVLLYCLWVAVCVLLSTRNETVCLSACCRWLFWGGHHVLGQSTVWQLWILALTGNLFACANNSTTMDIKRGCPYSSACTVCASVSQKGLWTQSQVWRGVCILKYTHLTNARPSA
jgi:hypothetical protein